MASARNSSKKARGSHRPRESRTASLTHLDERGAARMVDIAGKEVTLRSATARARVTMTPVTLELLREGRTPKGDVIAACRIAGISAAKKTPDLIPLCHAIALTKVEVEIALDEPPRSANRVGSRSVVAITARAEARDRTGVEMEALVAASVAALTLYDMLKAVERDIRIEEVVLLEKIGGRSGTFRRVLAEGR